jgi:hypothetical protein
VLDIKCYQTMQAKLAVFVREMTATERAREKKRLLISSFDGTALDITRKVLLCPCIVRALHPKAAKSNRWNAQFFLARVC